VFVHDSMDQSGVLVIDEAQPECEQHTANTHVPQLVQGVEVQVAQPVAHCVANGHEDYLNKAGYIAIQLIRVVIGGCRLCRSRARIHCDCDDTSESHGGSQCVK